VSASATGKRRLRRLARSFPDCLREFLTPALWKQARRRRGAARPSRWATQPLVLVLLLMTWALGDSQAERFEAARAFCVACLPRRRRPGRTVQGFQKALAKLPTAALRSVAAGLRRALAARLSGRWLEGGFVPLGCDGSRVECPRSAELERRLGRAAKDGSAPSVWVTALVHLRLGVPWAWRLGRGAASERAHLLQLLRVLPAEALVVADAGYVGFELCRRLVAGRVHFLIRLSSKVTLYREAASPLGRYREGPVYYWPRQEQQQGRPPLRLRLIRVRAREAKGDVWLLTDVMEAARLPGAVAARFYRWRWESEGQFRAYKRTLGKAKLVSRTLRLVHREAEGSLLALQLMLAQGALAMPKRADARGERPVCSPRQVLLAIRAEFYGRLRRRQARYYRRLTQARRDRRPRRGPKATRAWPRRKPHKPPGPPKVLTLTAEQKACAQRLKPRVA
jgi:hypothetical protein